MSTLSPLRPTGNWLRDARASMPAPCTIAAAFTASCQVATGGPSRVGPLLVHSIAKYFYKQSYIFRVLASPGTDNEIILLFLKT